MLGKSEILRRAQRATPLRNFDQVDLRSTILGDCGASTKTRNHCSEVLSAETSRTTETALRRDPVFDLVGAVRRRIVSISRSRHFAEPPGGVLQWRPIFLKFCDVSDSTESLVLI